MHRAPVRLQRAALLALVPLLAASRLCAQQWEAHATVRRLADELRGRYVFRDRGERAADGLIAADGRGAFADAKTPPALAAALDAFLARELHDKHLRVEYDASRTAPSPAPRAAPAPVAERYRDFERATGERENHGVRTVAQLAGNVGYLRVSGFPDAPTMASTLANAMALLHDTRAMIIDLRDNHGGDPEAVALLESYFFEPWRRRELNEIVSRTPGGEETHQYWTTPVPAALYYEGDVYVLTSSRTISGGEDLSYTMQAAKRATLVGEPTAGAANPARDVELGDGFTASIPFGRAVNPVTKTNWEGVGVRPDVATTADAALERAYVLALERAAKRRPADGERLRKLIADATRDPRGILGF